MRILHAADLHLDSPFASLTEEKAKLRRKECRAILGKLAAIANGRQADLVLLAGDLFDGANVYRETVEELANMLESIRCPVFITPGNHDFYRPRSPYTRMLFPEHVHLFASPEIRAVALEGCVVYGAAFWSAEEPESFLAGFRAFADDRLHIMCLHADLNGGPYCPITREQIQRSGLDYLALGHVHRGGGVQREGNTFYAYPGSAVGRGFDETGEKGCLLVDLEKGSAKAEFIPLDERQYVVCTSETEDVEGALAGARPQDVVRLVLTGESLGHVDAEAIAAQYGDRFFGFEVQDQRRRAEEIWSRLHEDSLRGLFLRELRGRYDAAETDEERSVVELAAKAGLAALDNRDV